MEHFSIYLLLVKDIFTSYLIFSFKSESIFYSMMISQKYNTLCIISTSILTFALTMSTNYTLGNIFVKIIKLFPNNRDIKMTKLLYVVSIFPSTVAWANFFSNFLMERRNHIKIFVSSILFKILHIFTIYIKTYS